MRTIRMIHPDLPGQEVRVSERAFVHHARSGWIDADVPAPPAEPAEAEPLPESEPVEPQPEPEAPRRGRTVKKQEE